MSTTNSKQWLTAGMPPTPPNPPMKKAAKQRLIIVLSVLFIGLIIPMVNPDNRTNLQHWLWAPNSTTTPQPDGPPPTMPPAPTPTLDPFHDYSLFKFGVYFRNGESAGIVAGHFHTNDTSYIFETDIPKRAYDETVAIIERAEVLYVKKGVMVRDNQGTWLEEQYQ